MNRLAFGCGPLGGVDRQTALATLETAWHGGIRHFDTAPSYGDGTSEDVLGQALRRWPRAEYTVSTKVGRVRMAVADPYHAPDGPRRVPLFDFTGAGVRESVLRSLRRLGAGHLDAVLVHDPDEHLELAVREAFPALERLRAEGVVGEIGVGTTSVETARRLVRLGYVTVVMIAGAWSLTRRTAAVLLDECAAAGVAVLAAAPFDSGLLASGSTYLYRPAPQEVLDLVHAMGEACREHGVGLRQAALRFPLRHPAVRHVVAGMRTPDEVRQNLALLGEPVPDALWPVLEELLP